MKNLNQYYIDLLGKEQAEKLLQLFSEIGSGKYNKEEIHSLQLKDIKHPVLLRAIRADMQSFVNTFIEPYLNKKQYMEDVKFVIDAGANIGYTAILFSNWWPESKIISIEPDKENFELTLKNTAAYKNIIVVQGALWNKKANLKIEAGQEDGFVVKEMKEAVSKIRSENYTVGISINQLMKTYRFSKIDFLKLNIEGSEKEVFSENYRSWLTKTKAMLIELHDGKNPGCSAAVFSAIHNFGFAVAETASYGILFARKGIYADWYSKWYKAEIYEPNINKKRFPKFYLDSN